jgi:hypothetical protein
MMPEYRYYVIVGDNFPYERPFALVRAWGRENLSEEEYFSRQLKWEWSDILARVRRGSMNRDEVRITEQEVEPYIEQFTQRFQENEQHGWAQ